MNFKNWTRFFIHTLLIGGFVTVITGFIVKWGEYKPLLIQMEMLELLFVGIWFFGVGLLFSVISQMVFFAYLTVHRIGLGIFRSLWNPVQSVIIAFVLFDLVYFRYQIFSEENTSIWPYVLTAVFLFLIGLTVAFLKMQQTNKAAFIPALFFMVVGTIIEWYPVLRVNDADWLYLMIFPLLICNMYQLLSLPKYIKRSETERVHMDKGRKTAVK